MIHFVYFFLESLSISNKLLFMLLFETKDDSKEKAFDCRNKTKNKSNKLKCLWHKSMIVALKTKITIQVKINSL